MQSDDFVTEWCAAWNAHDLNRVLHHFADCVIFTSPLAARILPETQGVITGKQALHDYWRKGLQLIPDLHFEVEHIFHGVDMIVIQYRNQKGALVSEVLQFRDRQVIAGHGTYE